MNIIYIFISNRNYPDSNIPNKLSKENIREDIQKIINEMSSEKRKETTLMNRLKIQLAKLKNIIPENPQDN